MKDDGFDYAAYLASPEWWERRTAAVERAGGRCQLCNTSKQLQVHHRTYERIGNEEPGDLTVLCERCHRKHHNIGAPKKSKSPKSAAKSRKRRKAVNKRGEVSVLARVDRSALKAKLGDHMRANPHMAYTSLELKPVVNASVASIGLALAEMRDEGYVMKSGKRWMPRAALTRAA